MNDRARLALAGSRCDGAIIAAAYRWSIAVPVLVLTLVVAPQRVAREVARLEKLPFAFDRDRSFELLGKERSFMSLDLEAA